MERVGFMGHGGTILSNWASVLSLHIFVFPNSPQLAFLKRLTFYFKPLCRVAACILSALRGFRSKHGFQTSNVRSLYNCWVPTLPSQHICFKSSSRRMWSTHREPWVSRSLHSTVLSAPPILVPSVRQTFSIHSLCQR